MNHEIATEVSVNLKKKIPVQLKPVMGNVAAASDFTFHCKTLILYVNSSAQQLRTLQTLSITDHSFLRETNVSLFTVTSGFL